MGYFEDVKFLKKCLYFSILLQWKQTQNATRSHEKSCCLYSKPPEDGGFYPFHSGNFDAGYAPRNGRLIKEKVDEIIAKVGRVAMISPRNQAAATKRS